MDLQTQCTNSPNDNEAISTLTTKKPFRSELNLVLSYPPPNVENEPPASPEINDSLPQPMELLTHTNPLYLQNLPTPFPSPIPSSPLTPPSNFKLNEPQMFDPVIDYSHLKFSPINSPIFASTNSIFCTVSAPSTPASDRKCIDKFCVNEETQKGNDKKKAKRVSIVNTKDEASEKISETAEVNEVKEGENKDKKPAVEGNGANGNNANHHAHKNHVHNHVHPKRRMSLDNTVVWREG